MSRKIETDCSSATATNPLDNWCVSEQVYTAFQTTENAITYCTDQGHYGPGSACSSTIKNKLQSFKGLLTNTNRSDNSTGPFILKLTELISHMEILTTQKFDSDSSIELDSTDCNQKTTLLAFIYQDETAALSQDICKKKMGSDWSTFTSDFSTPFPDYVIFPYQNMGDLKDYPLLIEAAVNKGWGKVSNDNDYKHESGYVRCWKSEP